MKAVKARETQRETGIIGLFPVRISRQEDGLYRAKCPAVENCWVDAPTLEEALADIQDAIVLCLRVDGGPSPTEAGRVEVVSVPFEFALPIAIP